MRRVSVTELKNRLSEFLRLVKRGETVEVLERSVPIARIQRVGPAARDRDAELERLIREGLVQRPEKRLDPSRLDWARIPCRADAVRALIEERDER